MCNEFSKAFDESKEKRVVFCDVSKAFDKVSNFDLLEYQVLYWTGLLIMSQIGFNGFTQRVLESIHIDACRVIRGGTKLCSIQKLYDEPGFETLQERRQKHRLYKMFRITLHRYICKPCYHNVYNSNQDIPYEIPTTIQYH